jgi:chromosome segregation ATPase
MVEEVRAMVSELERAEIPWVVAYLREDIQDLRNEVREVRRSVQRLDEKIDVGLGRLDEKIDVGLGRLDEKIDARTGELRQEIGQLRREMSVQFRWVLGTMVAVGALIVAALKLLP